MASDDIERVGDAAGCAERLKGHGKMLIDCSLTGPGYFVQYVPARVLSLPTRETLCSPKAGTRLLLRVFGLVSRS